MAKVNFTKAVIDGFEPTKKRQEVWDSKAAGLCLRISPAGVKSFSVVKKLNGKTKRVTLGRWPTLTVEQARKKAGKIASDMEYQGIDPIQAKRNQRAKGVTLGEIFEDYQKSASLRPNTLKAYSLAVERDLKAWKDKPLSSISGADVKRRHQILTKISPSVANRAMRVLRALFNHASEAFEDGEGRSLFPDNPTRKLRKKWNRESRRKNYIAPQQLPDWFRAVHSLPESMKRGDGGLVRDYLIFTLLTGLRRRETSGLKWEDIDLKAGRFIVRSPKNHDDLWLPLPDYLVSLLKARQKTAGEEYGPFPLEEPKRGVQRVRELSGVTFTVHDLRRTFTTIAESLDIGAYSLKALINHRTDNDDVTGGYIRINTERLREPMDKVATFILKAGCVEQSAEVVEITAAKKTS